MLNVIWVVMMIGALVSAALTGRIDEVTKASTDSAKLAVTLALGLIGVMAFWLGMMRVLQRGGLLDAMARVLKPVLSRLFPEVPAEHPAMSMMVMNMTSNMLGLGNAATPFGLKAMLELDKLNKTKGTASNAMCLFLAINTSGVAVLPLGMVAVRAELGSTKPGAIIASTLLATFLSTTVAVICAFTFSRMKWFTPPASTATEAAGATGDIDVADAEAAFDGAKSEALVSKPLWGGLAALCFGGAFAYAFVGLLQDVGLAEALKVVIQKWLLVILIGMIVIYGFWRGVKVYDALIEGAREGFDVALRIIPYMVAILVAVGMLRASGALGLVTDTLAPLTALVGMPAEVFPMAVLRTLSGSGAFGMSSELMTTHGPDSLIGLIASTMQGSTETTFYVLALYFGVVRVKETRHALPVCLIADTVGAIAAVWTCKLLLF